MRRPVFQEDDGQETYIASCLTRDEAEQALRSAMAGYYSRSDFYIAVAE